LNLKLPFRKITKSEKQNVERLVFANPHTVPQTEDVQSEAEVTITDARENVSVNETSTVRIDDELTWNVDAAAIVNEITASEITASEIMIVDTERVDLEAVLGIGTTGGGDVLGQDRAIANLTRKGGLHDHAQKNPPDDTEIPARSKIGYVTGRV